MLVPRARWMWSCEPRGRQRTYPVAYAPIAWVISLFPAKAPEKRIVPYVWPLYAGLPKSRMTTPVAPRFAAPQPCLRKTLRAVVFSYSEMVAREELGFFQVVERGRAGSMNAPRFFAHGDDAIAGSECGCEMNVSHFCESVANGVVDCAFADFTAFDVRDGNAQGERDRSRCEHFVAVGDEEKKSGACYKFGNNND